MAGARFATARKVASQTFTLVRQGPACAEFEACYTFDPKGESEPLPDLIKLLWLGAGAQMYGASGGVQLWDGDAAQPGAGRNIALVPLHGGSWRRAMACPVWHRDGQGVLTLQKRGQVHLLTWSV